MGYIKNSQNAIQNQTNQKGQTIVALRIPKYGTPPSIDNLETRTINSPFSLQPKPFYDAISYVTFPGVMPYMYLINTRGCIFDAITGNYHRPYNDDEYLGIGLLTIHGFVKKYALHRLVAFQFCKPPINFPDLIVNHINGDKHCDFANNLEWITMAANNHHSKIMHTGEDTCVINGRPDVDETFVRYICEQFELGKSNTEIMKDLGMEINNANHTLLRDIRGGYTWKNISSQYDFSKSSKKHAYTELQKDHIKEFMTIGRTDKEIFKLMQGREYVASTDRKDSSYRTIQTIRSGWFKRFQET